MKQFLKIAGIVLAVLVVLAVVAAAVIWLGRGGLAGRAFYYGRTPMMDGAFMRFGLFGWLSGLLMMIVPLGILVLAVLGLASLFRSGAGRASPGANPPAEPLQPPAQPMPAAAPPPAQPACRSCGQPLQPGWVACPYCGEKV